jgi:cell division protein FtsB
MFFNSHDDNDSSMKMVMMLRNNNQERHLQQSTTADTSSKSDTPFAILIMICILFCFIWIPLLCHRRCKIRRQREIDDYEQRQQTAENETSNRDAADIAAEIIRMSLRNLTDSEELNTVQRILGLNGIGIDDDLMYSQTIQSMNENDRREFIQNVLVSKVRTNSMRIGRSSLYIHSHNTNLLPLNVLLLGSSMCIIENNTNTKK